MHTLAYVKYRIGAGIFTFTDIPEPDILEGAGALAVNALELVLADNHVAESCTVLEDEHSAVAAGVFVRVAGTATVVFPVSHVL
jgi:hypothetical protein